MVEAARRRVEMFLEVRVVGIDGGGGPVLGVGELSIVMRAVRMAAKPLTSETIALTEKKMDMTLDDIIKMSKSNTTKANKPRVSNRNQKFVNSAAQEKSTKVRRFMDSRSSLRQGVLAQRRSNFQGNQFPLATEAARKAAVAPFRNRAFNRSRGFNVNKLR
ncbi:hypothetical protein CsSME_00045211 [Camellia sinensis var. sinensis]